MHEPATPIMPALRSFNLPDNGCARMARWFLFAGISMTNALTMLAPLRLPPLIGTAGQSAARRFLGFCTINIRQPEYSRGFCTRC
jgi:hypothetical protein